MALLSMTPVANATVTIPRVAPTIQAISYFVDFGMHMIVKATLTIVNMNTTNMAFTHGMDTLGRHGASIGRVKWGMPSHGL